MDRQSTYPSTMRPSCCVPVRHSDRETVASALRVGREVVVVVRTSTRRLGRLVDGDSPSTGGERGGKAVRTAMRRVVAA